MSIHTSAGHDADLSEPEGSVRVLVVDDVDVMREALAQFLGSTRGLAVVGVAADGAEAIEMHRTLAPDVIVMDLRMPRMDGPTATREITRSGAHPRVLMLSAYSDESLVRQALRAGACSYLLKDTPPEEIAAAVIATAQGRQCFSEELRALPIDRLVAESGHPSQGGDAR